MNRWIKNLKAKRSLLVVLFAIVITVVFALTQYSTKEKYKAYVSARFGPDMPRFVELLERADRLYAEILEKGSMNGRQSYLLSDIHHDLADIIRTYRDLAVFLRLRDDSFRYNQSSPNAMIIMRYFNDPDIESPINLDQRTRNHIAVFREFDSGWIAAVDRDIVSYRINDASWLRFLEAIETSTITFLAERQMDSLNDLWQDRKSTR